MMKLRLFCVVAALMAFAGAGHAADAGKKDEPSETGSKKLTIPSVEMGGGSVGISGTRPDDPSVPGFTDPGNKVERKDPFIGLKFNKPIGDK